MLDELQRRNYSQNTVSTYLHAVEDFSRYFHRSPDRLGPDHIRQYQAYLFRERKLQAGTIACCTAALRFLYVKTLRRPYLPEHIPFPKRPRQLPVILSPKEIERVIESAENLMRRTMVMTLYSTGIRCSELCHLKVSDIDSERMVIRVHKGKGGRDRDVLLSPKLLDTLREYWRWMKPKTYLFPGTVNNWRADVPITPKVVWKAVNEAGTLLDAARAGALLTHDASHKEFNRLHVEHFRNIVADNLGIATALAAGAKLGRAGDDLVDAFQMRRQFVAAGMILAGTPLLLCRLVALLIARE